MTKVALIFVNYRDYIDKYIEDCLKSLRLQTYPADMFQSYIVDNESSSSSKDFISKNWPEAKILERPDGNYSAANRLGIEQAKKDGFELFVLVNLDVKLDKDWLKELVTAVESDDSIGIAQSKLLLFDKSNPEDPKINSIGNGLHYLGFGYTNGYNKLNSEVTFKDEFPEILGYSSGCSLIIKKEVIEKIGNYDPEYYMYHDDIEVSWKSKLAGYKIVLAPKSIIFHKYQFSRSIQMFYYMERNRYLAVYSFYKIPTIILLLPMLLFMELGLIFHAIFNNELKTRWKIFKYFCRISSWQHIRNVRRKIKRIRQVKDKDLLINFSGVLLYQEQSNPLLEYIANPVTNLYKKVIEKIIFW